MSTVVNLGNGEVDLSRPSRRRYGVDFKLRILTEADACTLPGQVAALLRREGHVPDLDGIRGHWPAPSVGALKVCHARSRACWVS